MPCCLVKLLDLVVLLNIQLIVNSKIIKSVGLLYELNSANQPIDILTTAVIKKEVVIKYVRSLKASCMVLRLGGS